jgi:hypothetical protein
MTGHGDQLEGNDLVADKVRTGCDVGGESNVGGDTGVLDYDAKVSRPGCVPPARS